MLPAPPGLTGVYRFLGGFRCAVRTRRYAVNQHAISAWCITFISCPSAAALVGLHGLVTGDTDDDVVSDPVTVQWTVFDVLCGCTPSSSSSSSSPPSSSSSSSLDSSADVPYPAPTPYQFSSSSVSFKCGGAKDQFQITSAELSEVYGECFIAANESNSNGTITYSSDGTTYVGQFVVIPAEDPDGNVSLTYDALDSYITCRASSIRASSKHYQWLRVWMRNQPPE